MKGDYTTNSYYITHTIAFWKVGRIHLLSSGVKGLNGWECIRYLISNFFFLIWNKSIVFYWLPNLTDDHPLRSPTKDHSGSTTSHWVVLFHHFYSTNQQTFYDHSNTTIDVWEGWVRSTAIDSWIHQVSRTNRNKSHMRLPCKSGVRRVNFAFIPRPKRITWKMSG